jgi:Domain of unknown function (DUF4476)
MKKIFTLLVSSLFSLSLLAFEGSRLSISSPGTSKELKVEIDGRSFTMQNNAITLGYLQAGYHNVVIFIEKKSFRDRNRQGNGFGNDRRREVIFSSSVLLRKGFHVDITVNRFGKVMTDERRIDVNDEWYNDEDEYYDNENGGWKENRGTLSTMSGREFETLKESLRKEWFENNRLVSVRNVAEKTNFTTQQVKELMQLFTFESNRVEVAKAAYNKVLDKHNYFQLNDLLTFSSSKEDLARYIRECR